MCLFPEMWSIGYAIEDGVWDLYRLRASAVRSDGPFVGEFCRVAREGQLAIAITYLEDRPEGLFNSVALIDRSGVVLARYAKIHTTAFGAEALLSCGGEFVVAELPTRAGPVNVGIMICFDREFPESARALMLKGAEVIVTPNASQLEDSRIKQFQTRAFENTVGVAMANYPRSREHGTWPDIGHAAMNGQSVAFSPIAFDDRGEPVDPLLIRADEGEGIFIAEFDMHAIRSYRAGSVWAGAFRHPDAYTSLVELDVRQPRKPSD